MKRIVNIIFGSAAVVLLLILVIPLFLPQSGSGTRDYREAAGPDAIFVDIDGLDVHVIYQPHTGTVLNPPLIVLLHGFGANVYTWREVMEPLSSYGHVLAYDRPAFGWTQRNVAGLDFDPYSEAVGYQILDSLIQQFAQDSGDVVLVGHSAGGGVAMGYTLAHRNTVNSLVLVAPAIQLPASNRSTLRWLARLPQVKRTAVWLFGRFSTSGLTLLETGWHDTEKLTPEIISLYTAPTEIKGWEQALWHFASAIRGEISDAQLASLQQPVLIITGDNDEVVATRSSMELAAKIPNAALEVIPQSGHLPQEETPMVFLLAIMEHWQQLTN